MTVEHDLDGRTVTTLLGDRPETFRSSIRLPEGVEASDSVRTAAEWVTANDLIYWRNGGADKIYYSGLVYDTKMIAVPTHTVSISDGTVWAGPVSAGSTVGETGVVSANPGTAGSVG